jgi:hypothetical protein
VLWVLWKGALAIGAGKATATVLWPVHLNPRDHPNNVCWGCS